MLEISALQEAWVAPERHFGYTYQNVTMAFTAFTENCQEIRTGPVGWGQGWVLAA